MKIVFKKIVITNENPCFKKEDIVEEFETSSKNGFHIKIYKLLLPKQFSENENCFWQKNSSTVICVRVLKKFSGTLEGKIENIPIKFPVNETFFGVLDFSKEDEENFSKLSLEDMTKVILKSIC